MSESEALLGKIVESLKGNFQKNLTCIILYGSYAKGQAREDSDIDIIGVFKKLDRETKEKAREIVQSINTERRIELITSSEEDFRKERIPLYTAIKKEGKILYGNMDMTINPERPDIKYKEFFKKSKEFEMRKVEIAEEIFKKCGSVSIDLCFVPAKHAIQACLAMKGKGYSSKLPTLIPLTEKIFGKEKANDFRKLFELYVRSEYNMEELTEDEKKEAIEIAKRILNIYELVFLKSDSKEP